MKGISVEGSKRLLLAFGQELIERGCLYSDGKGLQTIFDDIEDYKYIINSTVNPGHFTLFDLNSENHFILPRQWDEALTAFGPFLPQETFEVGDWVVVKEGGHLNANHDDYAGDGYVASKTLKIEEVSPTGQCSSGIVCFFEKHHNGIYGKWLRKAKPEEIPTEPEFFEFAISPDGGEDLILRVTKEYIYHVELGFKSPKELKQLLLTLCKDVCTLTKGFSVCINSVNIGCKKNIPVESLQELLNDYEHIYGKIKG